MKNALRLTLSTIFALAIIPIGTASAQAYKTDAATDASELLLRSSCRAREVERYYCPSFGGGQWWGPYYDQGCSVTCANGQRAICEEASCEDGQSGQPVESSCTCR